MRKIHIILILAALFSSQQILAADDPDMMADKPCATIAKACMGAGYSRMDNANKKLWKDCMKPMILGQTVSGVTVDAATIQDCRVHKIDKMTKELDEMQKTTMPKST